MASKSSTQTIPIRASFPLSARRRKKGVLFVCIQHGASRAQKLTIGVPVAAVYEEVWNTELEQWGGVWKEHNETVQSQRMEDYPQTLTFTLPALGASIWKIKRRVNVRKNAKKDSTKE